MAYLTYNSLSRRTFSKATNLNEGYYGLVYPRTRVFLSYRREDKEWVSDIVNKLQSLGITVYIDYLDQTLEEQTSEHVASILRNRISQCTKFISLATPNSGSSKWMPWELGLGDRIINYSNVAILPLTTDYSIWTDQEYGNIYGRIELNDPNRLYDPNNWLVIFPDGRRMTLVEWIRS